MRLLAMVFFSLFVASCSHTYSKPENYENPIIQIDTELGSMTFELFEDKAPNTVASFISLAESGFYKNMFFHRVIPGVLVQGGCPNTKPGASGQIGTGKPDYIIAEEFHPNLNHSEEGILSMAVGSQKNAIGSQFIITFDKLPVLDQAQPVIGRILEGKEVLRLIEQAGTRNGKPKREILFNIKVIRKNDIKYTFNKS
jgi:peptidyl-prolyl cis-trans isomerase B (cyclophilin B)